MEWIKSIIEKYVDDEGKLDITKAMDEVNKEFPKNAVPKETFNQKNEDLKTANKLVADLKAENKDVEELQGKITDYEAEILKITDERAQEHRKYEVTGKLKEYGAKDIDYMLYKLGDTPIEELENKIKTLQEELPTHFESIKVEDTPTDTKGFKVIDNKLEDGQEPNMETIATNTFEEALGIKQ